MSNINKQIKRLLWMTATNISEGKYQQDFQTCLIEKINNQAKHYMPQSITNIASMFDCEHLHTCMMEKMCMRINNVL